MALHPVSQKPQDEIVLATPHYGHINHRGGQILFTNLNRSSTAVAWKANWLDSEVADYVITYGQLVAYVSVAHEKVTKSLAK